MVERGNETGRPEPPSEPSEVPKPTAEGLEPTTDPEPSSGSRQAAARETRNAVRDEYAKAIGTWPDRGRTPDRSTDDAAQLLVPSQRSTPHLFGEGCDNRAAYAPEHPVVHADKRRRDDDKAGNNRSDRLTLPTGEPGGTPDGHRTRIGRSEDEEVHRSLTGENSGAAVLAGHGGYRVKQNPTADEVAESRRQTGDGGRPEARPDYLIEGRVFDCCTPRDDKKVRGVWSAVHEKVENGQTQRVILNLQNWRGDLADLERQFASWPIEDLKEVKAITRANTIIQIVPSSDTDGES